MVQYTNLLVASAVAAVIPAMAAPFGGFSRPAVESRELNNVEAREPMFKAMIDVAAHGPARRVITAPLRKTAQDALDQHPTHYGPGPAQQAMNRILQEQRERQQPRPRDLEDFEEFDAREPMFKAIIDAAAHAPARRVITEPLKKTAHDALDQYQQPIPLRTWAGSTSNEQDPTRAERTSATETKRSRRLRRIRCPRANVQGHHRRRCSCTRAQSNY